MCLVLGNGRSILFKAVAWQNHRFTCEELSKKGKFYMLINKTAYLELSICWQILNELTSQPKQKCYKESGMMTQFVHFSWEGHPLESVLFCTLAGSLVSAFRSSLRQNLYIPRTKSGPQKQGDPASHLESWVGRRWPQRPLGKGMTSFTAAADPRAPESQTFSSSLPLRRISLHLPGCS